MSNPSKAKGTAAESAVVGFLRSEGWIHAERHAQHGNKDVGDVTGVPWVCEVKACKTLDLPGWLRELDVEMNNARCFNGVLVVKARGKTNPGDWYAVQRFEDWCDLAREAGWT